MLGGRAEPGTDSLLPPTGVLANHLYWGKVGGAGPGAVGEAAGLLFGMLNRAGPRVSWGKRPGPVPALIYL